MATGTITNTAGDTLSIDVGGFNWDNVLGTLADNSGTPVEGGTVFVLDMDNQNYLRETTDSDGKYEKDLNARKTHGFKAYAFFTDAAGTLRHLLGDLPKPNPTNAKSPYAKGVFIIFVGAGSSAGQPSHPCVSVDGLVYSFEGPGMLHYQNAGAYINRRRAEGRTVEVRQVQHMKAQAIHDEALAIRVANPPYKFTFENCAINACKLLNAGSTKDTFVPAAHPGIFMKLNQAYMMSTPGVITSHQLE